ncbi:hypothetical protein AB0D00_26355 [Streptomyces sp. NPDC048213]|uniref:hypothetical protein n=1 Tax=Streptomyces sp. NPDC048213 TaxID=3160984 RepID=UPI0033F61AF6
MLGLTVAMSPPAAADGLGDMGVGEAVCIGSAGPALGGWMLADKTLGLDLPGGDLCEKVGDAAEKKVSEAWKKVRDGALGSVIESAADTAKWVIQKVLTVALLGPSLDLKATGLFGRKATLAGMLYWLGLVIAAGGVMWQIGKMAVTGQSKHLGRAAVGWAENLLLSTIGVALFASMLKIGDVMTVGLVDATFKEDGKALERIVAVLLPMTVQNPMTLLGIVFVLLLVGFIQLVVIFLRQSAIPFICLLLPVAGGGRAGGDTTRQWAPRLITSGLVIITYKPILAVIICTGFAEFGHAHTLVEWLRGVATLVLGVLAPGPLTKIFAPFGSAVGAGMASGGASGALGAAAGYLGSLGKGGEGGDGGEGAPPATPMSHAQMVAQNMGPGGPDDSPNDSDSDNNKGPDRDPDQGGHGQSTRNHAQRNEANALPGQQSQDPLGEGARNGVPGGVEGSTATTKGAGSAALPVAVGIQVLDGVNDTVQGAGGEMGGGGQGDHA